MNETITNAILVSLCWIPVLVATMFVACSYRRDYLALRANLVQAADDLESKEIESRSLMAASQKRNAVWLLIAEEARAGSFRYASEIIKAILRHS